MMDREVDTSEISDRYQRLEEELFERNSSRSSSAAASTELLTAEFAARFGFYHCALKS